MNYFQEMKNKINEYKVELAEAKKELEDYKAVTKITLDKLQAQLQSKEKE